LQNGRINSEGVSRALTATQHDSFEILAPARWSAPMVFNSPHSGHNLPDAFLPMTDLTPSQLRASEDSHVDQLFSGCLDAGAPLMRALLSRSYLDLNREPYELDARMFRDRLPAYVNMGSPRVASGLGTLPRTVGEGSIIYKAPIAFEEALRRIETVYRPYHRALGALLDEALNVTGHVLLVDCHSMPSTAVKTFKTHQSSVDIVLGDRFGNSCDPEVTALAENSLRAAGCTVSRNKPYSGGFFTENHGRPRLGRHALQIEVNRQLYMDESSRVPHAGFKTLQAALTTMAQDLANWLLHQGTIKDPGLAEAAE
jgi:N-formylglutamate amidohydrolase